MDTEGGGCPDATQEVIGMPHDFQPSRQKTDLAEVVEMLLDKGIVINADIAVSIGDTQLLGVQVRAAIASFETAAKYGLEFPEGTDMRRLAAAVDEPELAEMDRPNPVIDPTRGVNVTPDPEDESEEDASENAEASDEPERDDGDENKSFEEDRITDRLGKRPQPDQPTSGGFDLLSTDSTESEEGETVETPAEFDDEAETDGSSELDATEDSESRADADQDDEADENAHGTSETEES